MEKYLKSIPDSELKVMMIIWNNSKKISTGEIFSELKDETEWKLSTLQIILTRLTEKGFLKNEKIGRYNYYYALIDGSEYTKFETRNFIKKMYNNSSKKLIASLIEDDNSLSDEDIKKIRNILNKGGV
ncbi:MAG: BlaI/MecI/CopY family transcriptional regulator [Clostridia bacterium]|nr:BlaI/MecI/CopY family transcriptional regulator [Clostridia bacterium]